MRATILASIVMAMAALASPIEPDTITTNQNATALEAWTWDERRDTIYDKGKSAQVAKCPKSGEYSKWMCCKHNYGHHHEKCMNGMAVAPMIYLLM